ncbi:MAG: hypothetical protein EBT79_11650 [Actinobacteria bacterium]|nr:hypothetical protein [Actinomycetota bacterium]
MSPLSQYPVSPPTALAPVTAPVEYVWVILGLALPVLDRSLPRAQPVAPPTSVQALAVPLTLPVLYEARMVASHN